MAFLPQKTNIPPKCQEFFLPVTGELRSFFLAHGINSGGISYRSPGFLYSANAPKSHNILLILSGNGRITTEQGSQDVTQGDLLIVPAGISNYKEIISEEWRVLWFWLAASNEWSTLEGKNIEIRKSTRGAQMESIIEMIISESERSNTSTNLIAELINVMATLLKEERMPHIKDAFILHRLNEFWNKVKKDLSKRWTLPEMSKKIGFSPRHFSRMNHTYMGASPIKYLISLRIKKAEEYLAYTDYPMYHISQLLGYKSAFDFSIAFKKEISLSPTAYRRSYYATKDN